MDSSPIPHAWNGNEKLYFDLTKQLAIDKVASDNRTIKIVSAKVVELDRKEIIELGYLVLATGEFFNNDRNFEILMKEGLLKKFISNSEGVKRERDYLVKRITMFS